MARIPTYDERNGPGREVPYPIDAVTGNLRQAASYERLQQGLAAWHARAQEEAQYDAERRVAEQVTLAQDEAGTASLVQPQGLPARYARQFRERAEAVFHRQLERDAQRTAFELREQHHGDPEGFSAAWQAYAEGVESGLRKDSPSDAVVVRQFLDGYGGQQYEKLAEAEFARVRANEHRAAMEELDQRQAEDADALLTSGDEEDYYERVGTAQDALDQLLDGGVISASEWEARTIAVEARYAKEMLIGRFTQRLDADDLGGAEAIITSLNEGKWFRDNDDARALANSLAAQLQARLKGAEDTLSQQVAGQLRYGKRVLSSWAHSGSMPGERQMLEDAVDFVELHGTPVQRQQAGELRNAIAMADAVAGGVPDLTLSAATGLLDALGTPDARLLLDDTTRDVLVSQLERQRRSIEKGLAAGDYIPGDLTFDNPAEVGAEALQARRERAARVMGLPVNDVPVWSNDETRWFREQLRDSQRSQRYDAVDSLLSSYLGGYGGHPGDAMAAATALAGEAGDLYLPAMLHAVGEGGDLTNELLHWQLVGANASEADIRAAAGAGSLRDDRKLVEMARTAAMGDDNLQDAILQSLTTAQVGLLADGTRKASDARAELRRIMSPFADSSRLRNGQRLPAQLLASFPEGARVVVDVLDSYLDDPAALNLPLTATAEIATHVLVQPMPGGGFGFRHRATSRWLTDASGEPIRVLPDEVIQEAGVTPNEAAGWFANALDSVRGSLRAAREASQTTHAGAAATMMGVPQERVAAVHRAVQTTPTADRGWRSPHFGLPSDIDRRADWDRIPEAALPRAPDPGVPLAAGEVFSAGRAVTATTEPYLAAQHLQRLAKAFPGDDRAQLAAYWETPELVKDLQKKHGDGWYQALPLNVQEFVQRVLRQERGDD